MSTEEKNLEGAKGNLIIDHEYDGIQELDNKPPSWLMLIFYGTIIFAIGYWFHFQVLKTGKSQAEEYEAEMAEAAVQYKATDFDESKITLITDAAQLNEAKALFVSKTCVACHGANGEGNTIGPNLTDHYWIHGNTPEELFKVIKYGVPEKGMTPFKDMLSNKQIQLLVSHILVDFVGSNPENPKEAQGELFE